MAATGEGAEMTKPEIPMPKECRMTENSNPFPGADPFSEFGFRISFGIRPLAFVIHFLEVDPRSNRRRELRHG